MTSLETRVARKQPSTISAPQDPYEFVTPMVAGADREYFLGIYLTASPCAPGGCPGS